MESLSCLVCCEGFAEDKLCPRLLGCGHSFCTGCLEKMIQSALVKCPVCRKEIPVPTGVMGLPKSLVLLDSLHTTSAAAARKCDACDSEHPATFSCLDCNENFCQEASSWHTRNKLLRDHRVVSLEEIKANPELQGVSNLCPDHSEPFRFFDEQCGRVICRDCVALTHHSHKCSSLAAAGARWREGIGAIMDQAADQVKQAQEAEARVDEMSQCLDRNHEQEAAKISATFQQIRDAATAREILLLSELTQLHKAKSSDLINQRDLLHISRAHLDNALKRAEAAVKSNDDVRLLVSGVDLTATLSAFSSPPALPTNKQLVFSLDPATLLAMVNVAGVVSDKRASAAWTYAHSTNWRARPGGQASFTITARDSTGARCEVGGETFVVQIQPEGKQGAVVIHPQALRELEAQVIDHNDGTYEVHFMVPRDVVGNQKLFVSVYDSPIRGSPFHLTIDSKLLFIDQDGRVKFK